MSAKELLIQLFNLPKNEIIFQDYSCALKGLFSKYGRIFLAEQHICFYANLAGSKTKLVLKLDDVKTIDKKNKSDIEIVVNDGRIYCFNQFSNRDQVYNLMSALFTGQPITGTQAVSESVVESNDGENVLENADVEISFLNDGGNGEAAQEISKLTFQFNTDKFFDLFLSDDAIYSYVDHRKAAQDQDIQLSKWQPMEENYGTYQRELKTIIKLVGVPFKDSSRMHKFQTYKKEDGKLTLNSTTHTLDVPYANYFQMEERWEVTNIEENKCQVRQYAWVVFTKSTMMKGKILPRSIQGIKEDYENWANNVKQKLEILAKPVPKASAISSHEYEDSKNLDQLSLKKEHITAAVAKKPQYQGPRLDIVLLAVLGILIGIMLMQLVIMNNQSDKIDSMILILEELLKRKD